MLADFASARVVVRPYLPQDEADILEFCKYIWDGNDYIHHAWPFWLAETDSEMFVAEYAGHAIGLARLVHMAPGQWWLEGLRVDVNHQDKKIGSLLHGYCHDHWLEHGDGTIRLWTSAQRVKVHHLCEIYGFSRGQDMAIVSAPALDEPVDAFTSVVGDEIPEAVAFALQAESLALGGGLLDIGWRVAIPNETSFRTIESWEDSHIVWWRGRQGLLVTWGDEDEIGAHPMIGLAACTAADLDALLLDSRRVAARDGCHKVAWHAPVGPALEETLVAAGFAREGDTVNCTFEKRHPER
ncbi:MAG: GNAT family N-acetyltransferase [Chloroflexota bacterium]